MIHFDYDEKLFIFVTLKRVQQRKKGNNAHPNERSDKMQTSKHSTFCKKVKHTSTNCFIVISQ